VRIKKESLIIFFCVFAGDLEEKIWVINEEEKAVASSRWRINFDVSSA